MLVANRVTEYFNVALVEIMQAQYASKQNRFAGSRTANQAQDFIAAYSQAQAIVYRLPPHRLRPTTAAINRLLSGGLLQHPRTAIHTLDDIATAHEQVEAGADAKLLIRL